MSLLAVPMSTDPYYSQTTNLQGTDYILTFYYSTREACWYMSISTSSDVEIASCLKLVCNTPLLLRVEDLNAPPGLLLVVSSTNDDRPPGLLDLDPDTGRCQLIYAEAPPL